MNQAEILLLFSRLNCARLGGIYAPHKPVLLLLVLEKILNGHINHFLYVDLDHDLKKLLEKYGSNNASNTRNEPFWRLKNDGIWNIEAPTHLLALSNTPTPTQLIEEQAAGVLKIEIYETLKQNPALIKEIALQLIKQFIAKPYQTPLLADAAPSIKRLNRKYWWVSQNQTYKQEVPGNFMWSPKTNSNGGSNPSYNFMTQMQPDDVVFSFAGTYIKAVGVVTKQAVSSVKPDFGNAGANWSNDGWLVDVAFEELKTAAFKPNAFMNLLAPTLPNQYSPIRADGTGNQIYLAQVPIEMAEVLLQLSGRIGQEAIMDLSENIEYDISVQEDALESAIAMRTDIGETQKSQIITSRRGQGVFKANVRLVETFCRVTKVANSKHLIASHIKPWKKSTDVEKLSGFNGLLLSPHIDHLFDKGYISFEPKGSLIISSHLEPSVLDKWQIDKNINVGQFRTEQKVFLEYHRDVVFR